MLLAGIRWVTEGVDFFFKMPLQGSTARSQGLFFIFSVQGVRLNTVQLGIPLVAYFQALMTASHWRA